ncbi:maleylpyruvate isomerase N-terminal domain-containing protein [Kocuria rosea]|uniref:Mycothiol maleylpyruvate isomerase n=1 Tax=Kocuria rosea TaxID=1275 RepID=A0A4R5YD47_KOCRO|nr:maleylpyruvate isomerase N-terminal domain-containing protein [Kocuria rosea]TDL42961.1 mycothiol maleylpyruvate isomerase [Kocuria rosea]
MSRDPAVARTALLDAGAWFADLVGEIRPHHWTRPGLGAWDVRALVGHTHRALVTLGTYLTIPADDETCTGTAQYYALSAAATDPAEVAARGVAAGRELGRHPAATVRASLDRARDALAQVPVDDDPLIRTLVGGTRLRAYVPTRTFELAVHGLDVAQACGLDRRPPEHVLADAGRTALELAAHGGHLPGVLLALTGRRPLPPGFSVLG